MGLSDERSHSLETFVAELANLAADTTEQVLVVWRVARRLEPAEAFTEVSLYHQTAPHQQFEGAVNCRGTHSRTLAAHFSRNFLGRQVAVGAQHDACYCEAL